MGITKELKVQEGDGFEVDCYRNDTSVHGCSIVTPKSDYYAMHQGAQYSNGKIISLNTSNTCGALVKRAEASDQGQWQCHLYFKDGTNGTLSARHTTMVNVLPLIQTVEPIPNPKFEAFGNNLLRAILYLSVVLVGLASIATCIYCIRKGKQSRIHTGIEDAENGEINENNNEKSIELDILGNKNNDHVAVKVSHPINNEEDTYTAKSADLSKETYQNSDCVDTTQIGNEIDFESLSSDNKTC